MTEKYEADIKSNVMILSIPKPCQEDWNKMSPTEKGRFCNACHKSILDFSQLSDEEIITILKKERTACGRFDHSQLNRPIFTSTYKQRTIPWWKSLLIAVAVFFIKSPVASAFKENASLKETGIYPKLTKSSPNEIDTGKIVLKGKVYDEKTGEEIVGAQITLLKDGAKIAGATTDIDGNFEVTAPKGQNLTLQCFFLGYDHYVFENINASNMNIKIEMKTANGGMVTGILMIQPDDFSIVKKYMDR